MNKILIISPHPDDEILGSGGTILKHKKEGCKLYWIIVTQIAKTKKNKRILEKRSIEINKVKKLIKADKLIKLGFKTANLSQNDLSNLIINFKDIFNRLKPNILYLPHHSDAHSDHRIIYDAAITCTKWFRFPYIKKIFLYETLSETNFNYKYNSKFNPNYYVDITKYLKKKLKIMKIYKSEIKPHPFPRSIKAIESLSYLRGSESGFYSAEAFEIIKILEK